MGKPIDLRKIIDFDTDYYAVLGLEKGCLPTGNTREDKKKVADILLRAMRGKMWDAHPDHGGSEAAFKLVTRAQWILENPIWRLYWETRGETGGKQAEDATGFEIDWEKIGTYQQGTPADTIGYGLFTNLNQRAKELGIVPAFSPSEITHSYEWDWAIPDLNAKLALALVYDEGDVLRLTGRNQIADALPFKIYFCFPRAALHFQRTPQETVEFGDVKIVFNGTLQGAMYSDYNLLETTHLQDALDYVKPGGKLESDLAAYRDGSLVAEQKAVDRASEQYQWLPPEKVKEKDANMLKDIMRATMWRLTPNPNGADFLKDLPDD
jgi:hypothetical protein